MAKYAIVAGNNPQLVVGWVDTDFVTYPTLPSSERMIPIGDATWQHHLQDLNAKQLGPARNLIDYVPPPTPSGAPPTPKWPD
jgi:hypothetical protein